MITKVCFKCGIEKPLDEFYPHNQMGDGHLNKCKACTKHDAFLRERKLRLDPAFCEKEKQRSKEKYHRLNYRERQYQTNKRNPYKSNEYKQIHKKLRLPENKVAHHWNYNKMDDVIILNKSDHRHIHRFIKLNKTTMRFVTIDGKELKSKNDHLKYITFLLGNKFVTQLTLKYA